MRIGVHCGGGDQKWTTVLSLHTSEKSVHNQYTTHAAAAVLHTSLRIHTWLSASSVIPLSANRSCFKGRYRGRCVVGFKICHNVKVFERLGKSWWLKNRLSNFGGLPLIKCTHTVSENFSKFRSIVFRHGPRLMWLLKIVLHSTVKKRCKSAKTFSKT